MVKTGRHLWAAHPHVRSGSSLTFGERAADVLKARFGSWPFLIILNAVFFTEVGIHFATGGRFDSGLLLMNLGLSWLAAQQGGALQIAANRGDRISSEVATGTHKNSAELLEMNKRQLEILARLDGLTDQVAALTGAVRTSPAAKERS